MTSRQKRKLTEFLFLLPTLIAFLMVIIIPFIFGIYYSFTDWQGTGAVSQSVGFANYRAIFQEPAFLHSFLKTLLFTVLNIITVKNGWKIWMNTIGLMYRGLTWKDPAIPVSLISSKKEI